jgi:c-di-AMP phosphodiesterase-like protein
MTKPNVESNADVVAELAGEIFEFVAKRSGITRVEAVLAMMVAIEGHLLDCGCKGCRCGEVTFQRAKREIANDNIGRTAFQMFLVRDEE